MDSTCFLWGLSYSCFVRILRKALLCILLLLLLAAGVFSWWAGSELAHPSRRVLQDYHEEYLAHPTDHGMVIKKFTLQDGTPCLMCEPMPNGHLAKRGQIIREQFAQKQIPLKPAGEILATLVLNHGRKGGAKKITSPLPSVCAPWVFAASWLTCWLMEIVPILTFFMD